MSTTTPCYLCQDQTEHSCPECGLPSCSSHLPTHLVDKVCLPFTVLYKEGVGRYVVATRDIKASEVILEDHPAVLGPNYETEAVCLECLSRADGSVLCHHCNLPLCSDKCRDGPKHKAECDVFREMEKKVVVARFGSGTIAYEYGCITVLRLLALRDTNPETWARVQFLMDHEDERRKEKEYWQMFQKNVVDYLRIRVGLADTYSEEEIHRAIGILRTNAFQIEHPYLAAQGTSGKAIYPTFSFLSHSCISNAKYSVMPDDRLTLRAQVDIKEGDEITIQYISFLFGNSRRRKEISDCWMFECKCPRCEDTTELGSFLSALLCTKCQGTVLPEDSRMECKMWKCKECGQNMEQEKVLGIVEELKDEMYDTMEHEFEKYQKLEEKFSALLHPNHYQLQILNRHLAGSIKGSITMQQMALRQKLMEGFIKVFEIVDPGLTKWRGKMLFQVCKTRMFFADRKHSKEETDKEAFLAEMKNNIADMEDVVECLKHEPETSSEFRIAKMAETSLKQARDLLSMMALLG
eukprot:GFUD01014283.1.p1 GENE.GFUD01014283.1~~GFUD01014283.1.p1  ORF type:complete len:522 (+),score=161.87 GFUD01014283.1:236-1801(+)